MLGCRTSAEEGAGRTWFLLSSAMALLLMVMASTAHAATAVKSGDTLSYDAGPGESNQVTVEVFTEAGGVGGAVTITDPGASITAGAGCGRPIPADPHRVRCGEPGSLDLIRVSVADGADSVVVRDFSGAVVGRYGLSGGAGDDTLDASAAQSKEFEALLGDDGNDTLIGGLGTQNFIGGPGADVMIGGGGVDSASYAERNAPEAVFVELNGVADDGSPGPDGVSTAADFRAGADNVMPDIENVTGGDGNDRLIGNAAVNTLVGGLGNDALEGREREDTLLGGVGDDNLQGGDGGDIMVGGVGADVTVGGSGVDTVSYGDRLSVAVKVTLDGQANDGESNGAEGDNAGGNGVENIIGGAGSDTLTGNGLANVIFGGAGNDLLKGLGGADRVLGEGDGDNLQGGDGADTLIGGLGGDVMGGGAGVDAVSYEDREDPDSAGVVVDLDGVADDGQPGEGDNTGTGVENITGGAGDDTLRGNSGANRLIGGGRNDSLFGLGGNDVIDSNDGLLDQVFCGGGTDRAAVDLKDGPPNFPDCETVEQAAVDQHPAVRIDRRAQLLVGPQELRVVLRCPRKLRQGCDGQLRAVLKQSQLRAVLKNGKPALANRHYRRIRRGDQQVITLRLSERETQVLARRGRLWFQALDRDRHGQPKHTVTLARLEVLGG
jgi:Ca2+-binding RTX toxin-like protein